MNKRRIFTVVSLVLVFTSLLSMTACNKKFYGGKTAQNNTQKSENTNSDTVNIKSTGSTSSQLSTTLGKQDKSQLRKIKAKALYLTGWTAGVDANIQHFIELANTTEVNAYVIDIKDDDGLVAYNSNIPAVKEAGAVKYKYNPDKVIKELHDNNIYVIGRLVCFNDPVYSSKRQDLAVKNMDGSLYRDKKNHTWLNPYNKESWPYIIEIAKEAIQKGFDEIQFDYVRFPNDGNKKNINFGSTQPKNEAIDEFLAYAKKEITTVPVSADIFGIVCESPGDTEDIGQYLEYVGKDVDAICPMVYPSHYAVGQIVNGTKYVKPDLEPYGVVYNSIVKAKDRLSKVEQYNAKMRPYLQAFTATWLGAGYYQNYGAEQIRQQIKAVYDAGYDEWILWDPACKYPDSAFIKE